MYHIYLEHDPREPLYSTSSLKDAQEYYEYYKPFHSDMYIQTTEQENNLVIFPGHLKHRSVNQTDENVKLNLNINLKDVI